MAYGKRPAELRVEGERRGARRDEQTSTTAPTAAAAAAAETAATMAAAAAAAVAAEAAEAARRDVPMDVEAEEEARAEVMQESPTRRAQASRGVGREEWRKRRWSGRLALLRGDGAGEGGASG